MTQVVYFGAGDLGEGGKEGMKERENWGLGEGGGAGDLGDMDFGAGDLSEGGERGHWNKKRVEIYLKVSP